jgi:5-hydroxyisourate hydrolase-like protein (transthyretin family)
VLLGKLLTVVVLLALALGAPAGAAPADREDVPATEPGLHLTAPPTYAGEPAPVSVVLSDAAGGPVVGASVRVERQVAGEWTGVAVVVTDAAGTAALEAVLSREPADNVVRATWDATTGQPAEPGGGTDPGEEAAAEPQQTGPVVLPLRRRNARAELSGPDSLVDETSVRLALRWRTGGGEPVTGEVVLEEKRGDRWRKVERLRTDEQGRASTRVAPREDTRYRVRTPRQPWLERDTSPVHRLDNTPPGTVVRLGGPVPRRSLPRPPRAVGDGPAPTLTRIPAKVWRSMTGRTWRAGCPVGRDGLRLLRINHWGYDGYRYRGELVAAASVVGQMSGALSEMYRAGLPVRAMFRADRFGWSPRLRGADDYASMAAGNTSAFNCRQVVGRPGVRSPHAWGRSLDINTWENPYRSSHGLVPNSWWASRSHPRVAWRSSAHRVVSIMRRHGLRWTYGTADSHHFDAVPRSGGRGAGPADDAHDHGPAPVLPPVCATQVCD